MVGPCISFVATLSWIAVGEDNLNSLWLYGQTFQASFEFFFEKLLSICLVYG
jgi:hypothetical protein